MMDNKQYGRQGKGPFNIQYVHFITSLSKAAILLRKPASSENLKCLRPKLNCRRKRYPKFPADVDLQCDENPLTAAVLTDMLKWEHPVS